MTWSLGVEEQFYIVFPFVLLAIMRWAKRYLIHALALLTLASLTFSLWCTYAYPAAAFYLLPSRAWELGLGTLLAAWQFRRSTTAEPKRAREMAGWLGAAMLAVSITSFDETMAFPGFIALLPALGAAMLLWSEGSTINRRLLAARPVVFVGLVSYSWYLWHWPLMSYLRITAAENPSVGMMLGTATASFVLAILSWKYIEQPFRHSTRATRPLLVRYACILAVFIAATGAIKYSQGMPQRLHAQALATKHLIEQGHGDCLVLFEHDHPDTSPSCIMKGDSGRGIALIGDSHAAAIGPGLRALAQQRHLGLSIYTKSACPPLLGVRITREKMPYFAKACASFMHEAFNTVANDKSITTVVIAGYWNYYKTIGLDVFGDGLARSILRLRDAGKKVIIANDVPKWSLEPAQSPLPRPCLCVAGWPASYGTMPMRPFPPMASPRITRRKIPILHASSANKAMPTAR